MSEAGEATHDSALNAAQAYQLALVRFSLGPETAHAPALLDATRPALHVDAWCTYRRMMRARLAETIEHAFVRLHARIGADVFSMWVDMFLAEAPPHALVLRFVPREFLTFLRASITRDAETQPASRALPAFAGLPAWTLDLAQLEWAELDSAYAPEEAVSDQLGALAMDRPLVCSSSCRVLKLDHRVHDVSRDEPHGEIVPGVTWVCAYRDRVTFDVRVLELTEAAALLITDQHGTEPLVDRIRAAAAATGATLDLAWLNAFATYLVDLTDRGVVLGSRT